MEKNLWEHIKNNLELLQNRDFIFEIFTGATRIEYNEVMNIKNMYKGKLCLKNKKLHSIEKFEYIEFSKYKILELNEINIENKKILADATDKIKIEKDILSNVDKDIDTTLGRFLLNYLLLHIPFKDKIPYLNTQKEISFKYISNILYNKFIDDEIKKSQIDTFSQNLYFIGSMSYIFVPVFTKKSITTHPDMEKRRSALLKKYKTELEAGDTLTMSKIETELIDLDKEWLKDDDSMRFYNKNLKKSFSIQRKKQYCIGGITESIGDSSGYKFIDEPFSQGVNEENFSKVANELRAASHARAVQTQDSGVLAKSLSRSLVTLKHIKGDCKTKDYIKLLVNDFNTDKLINRYIAEGSKLTLLTKENINKYEGKEVNLRSPMLCKEKNGYCSICIGKIFNELKTTQLDFRALSLSSFYTNLKLKRSHGIARSIYTIEDLDKFVY